MIICIGYDMVENLKTSFEMMCTNFPTVYVIKHNHTGLALNELCMRRHGGKFENLI